MIRAELPPKGAPQHPQSGRHALTKKPREIPYFLNDFKEWISPFLAPKPQFSGVAMVTQIAYPKKLNDFNKWVASNLLYA